MKTLALIPARSGSKSIPGKNTRLFCGLPLFQWAVEVGMDTCDLSVVSTDSKSTRWAAESLGAVSILAGPPLHTDDCAMLDVVSDVVGKLDRHGFDIVVLLQPTQPLRKPEHIQAALKLLEETGADSVVSVVEILAHYSPGFVVKISSSARFRAGVRITDPHLEPAVERCYYETPTMDDLPRRRQDAEPAYSRDGTVYAIRREVIEAGSLYGYDCRPLVIPHSESVNLDTEEDWQRAEAMKGHSDGKRKVGQETLEG